MLSIDNNRMAGAGARLTRMAAAGLVCLLVRTGRRLVFRLLAWNPWQATFLRGVDHVRAPLQC